MKNNQPLTQREFAATPISTTNVDSRIVYANAAFVAASGVNAEELVTADDYEALLPWKLMPSSTAI